MKNLLRLSVAFAGLSLGLSPTLAQGYINPPIYSPGIINQVGGTTINTVVAASYNHPTDLRIYNLGTITTWNITLPTPPYDGQSISLGCQFAVTTINWLTTDGSAIGPGLPITCGANSNLSVQYSSVYNTWRYSQAGTLTNFIPLGTGVSAALAQPAVGSGGLLLSSVLPSASSSVQGTGIPGLDGNLLGYMFYSAPTTSAQSLLPNLRLQKVENYTGGTYGATESALWVLDYSSPTGKNFNWSILSELHNYTDTGVSAAENVAVNGTAYKQFKGGYVYVGQVGPTWGSNFVCNDQTATVNPVASCIGSELDSYAAVGAGTDTAKARVGLQIVMGVAGGTDTGVHFGRAILMQAGNGGVIDAAIELDNAASNTTFLLRGDGSEQISSNYGHWSANNYGKGLVVLPETNGTVIPAIGISDLNGTNFFAMANVSGALTFSSMPALGDSSTGAVVILQLSSTGQALYGTTSLPSVTTGTPTASLCINASNQIIKKTTAGSCV